MQDKASPEAGLMLLLEERMARLAVQCRFSTNLAIRTAQLLWGWQDHRDSPAPRFTMTRDQSICRQESPAFCQSGVKESTTGAVRNGLLSMQSAGQSALEPFLSTVSWST